MIWTGFLCAFIGSPMKILGSVNLRLPARSIIHNLKSHVLS